MGVMIQRPGAFVHHKPRPSNSAVRVDRSRHAASPGVYRLLLAGHWRGEAVRPAKAVAKDSRSVTSLSELITFEVRNVAQMQHSLRLTGFQEACTAS